MTILVGLSGGVDSAVAAHCLLQQGHQVAALFMKNWEEDDTADYCSAAADLAAAQAVADQLGIELQRMNFASEYWERVFEYFLREYQALRTPNPDVLCNREIKFGAFLDQALTLGAQSIATGHYARLTQDDQGFHLRLSADPDKDQTYFLYQLNQDQLRHACFPLGNYTKSQVRTIAQKLGLPNATRKDSTGICFIGERRFRDFLARYLPVNPGPIETDSGQVIGEHQGLAYYTIGQRQGLGIGGQAQAAQAPWFVAAKEVTRNTLIVVQGHDHPLLFSRAWQGEQLHWIAGQPPQAPPIHCQCRLRHRQPLHDCTIIEYDSQTCQVRSAQPQRAVTPGQSAVFYQGDECLGGAIITQAC